MNYQVTFNWTDETGAGKRYTVASICREVGISQISNRMRRTAMNISAHFHHQSTPYTQEIAEAFGLKYELIPSLDAFAQQEEFVISGNDQAILPAWYWIILALRYRGDAFPSFINLLEQCVVESDQRRKNSYHNSKESRNLSIVFYGDCDTADYSLRYWKRFIEEKDTPTTAEMLKSRSCIISYFYNSALVK